MSLSVKMFNMVFLPIFVFVLIAFAQILIQDKDKTCLFPKAPGKVNVSGFASFSQGRLNQRSQLFTPWISKVRTNSKCKIAERNLQKEENQRQLVIDSEDVIM